MAILSLWLPLKDILFPSLDSLNSPASQPPALSGPFLSGCSLKLERGMVGGNKWVNQVDPFSFLEDWEDRRHGLWASFSPCPLELRTTPLAAPQPVTTSPSLAVCLPRNSPLGLRAFPADGDPNLCCLHGGTPGLQEVLGSQQLHRHSRRFLLLWMELCWGRRLR